MVSQLTEFAKKLWSRLSTAADQLFRPEGHAGGAVTVLIRAVLVNLLENAAAAHLPLYRCDAFAPPGAGQDLPQRLHHQSRAVTTMSPLRFQKRLQQQQARRLMLSEYLDAASAAFRVGYHGASHCNREYESLFGVLPAHNVQRLREEALETNS